jgi:hypothetical protein
LKSGTTFHSHRRGLEQHSTAIEDEWDNIPQPLKRTGTTFHSHRRVEQHSTAIEEEWDNIPQAIEEEWDNIPQATIYSLINSM